MKVTIEFELLDESDPRHAAGAVITTPLNPATPYTAAELIRAKAFYRMVASLLFGVSVDELYSPDSPVRRSTMTKAELRKAIKEAKQIAIRKKFAQAFLNFYEVGRAEGMTNDAMAKLLADEVKKAPKADQEYFLKICEAFQKIAPQFGHAPHMQNVESR